MDLLAWALECDRTRRGRAQISALYRVLRLVVPKGVLMNRIACGDFVQGLHHLEIPPVIAIMGGIQTVGGITRTLRERHPGVTFWAAGNRDEQQRYLAEFRYQDLTPLHPSTNTKEEAERIVACARRESLHSVGILDYECHVVRSILTLVQQALHQEVRITFVPFAYIDKGRESLSPAMLELALLVEAIKLWWYQDKGDIAKLENAITYYGDCSRNTLRTG